MDDLAQLIISIGAGVTLIVHKGATIEKQNHRLCALPCTVPCSWPTAAEPLGLDVQHIDQFIAPKTSLRRRRVLRS